MTTENTDLIKQIRQSASIQFVPFAYYDKHMDCIRIELRDCSSFEKRLNQYLTLAFDNYPEKGQDPIAGVTIKGVKHFFAEWNLPFEGIYLVADLLDRIVKEMSLDDSDRKSIDAVKFIATNIEMPLDLSLAA